MQLTRFPAKTLQILGVHAGMLQNAGFGTLLMFFPCYITINMLVTMLLYF